MNSGIYVRVNKENVLLEHMTEEQRTEWLKTLNTEGLIRTVNILSNVAQYLEIKLDKLESQIEKLDLDGDYDDYIK